VNFKLVKLSNAQFIHQLNEARTPFLENETTDVERVVNSIEKLQIELSSFRIQKIANLKQSKIDTLFKHIN